MSIENFGFLWRRFQKWWAYICCLHTTFCISKNIWVVKFEENGILISSFISVLILKILFLWWKSKKNWWSTIRLYQNFLRIQAAKNSRLDSLRRPSTISYGFKPRTVLKLSKTQALKSHKNLIKVLKKWI